MTRKVYLRREAAKYMATVDLTPSERQDIHAWVEDGNSVYDNPWYMADDRGCPMDYISAIREVNCQRLAKGL